VTTVSKYSMFLVHSSPNALEFVFGCVATLFLSLILIQDQVRA